MRYAMMFLGLYLVLSGDLHMGNGKVKEMVEQLAKRER